MRGALAAGAALLCASAARAQVAPAAGSESAPLPARQADSLAAAADRAARAWRRHDFAALVAGTPGVLVRLGRAEPSAPLPPAQAVGMLRSFAGGAEEVLLEVTAVRATDAFRGYAEVLRTYVARGTSARRAETLYFGWRFTGPVPRLTEIRLVP